MAQVLGIRGSSSHSSSARVFVSFYAVRVSFHNQQYQYLFHLDLSARLDLDTSSGCCKKILVEGVEHNPVPEDCLSCSTVEFSGSACQELDLDCAGTQCCCSEAPVDQSARKVENVVVGP